jgi:radical SAM superfamily enzyme YgiQ (UPF0313 family)
MDDIVGYCSSFGMVAFSCYIWNIAQTLEAARRIKQLNGSCRILLGGPEVSYEWDNIIALTYVDFIITGEGEIPFSKLLELYPRTECVPGLIWKKNGEVVVNNEAGLFDLQQLQRINPYASVPVEELQHRICYMEASRGCPNCCDFCLAGLHNKVRYLPQETIEQNLLYLMEHGRVIKFLDRTFNTHPAFAISMFRFILEHHRPGNIFQFEIKADILQDDLISFVKTNVPKGIFRFEIGIQTLNARSNHEVRRKQNFENIKTFVGQIADKVEIHLDLIVGLPYDYYDDIRYSFEEVFKLFAPELQLGFLKFLKGTPIRDNYREHDYSFDPAPPYQIVESKYMSTTAIEKISVAEHALDIFWNKKRAPHSLRYVALHHSIFDFLVGLGEFWKDRNGLTNDGLTGLYTLLHDYAVITYPADIVLHELIALDYYLQHKVKPGIRFLPEVSKAERNQTIEKLQLNHHRYRYVMHPVHFAVAEVLETGIVQPSLDRLIIEYSGTTTPRIVAYRQENRRGPTVRE